MPDTKAGLVAKKPLATMLACAVMLLVHAAPGGAQQPGIDEYGGGEGIDNGISPPYGNGVLRPGFAELDQDGDGVITPWEAAQSETLLQQFTEVDANQDGLIDASEFAAFETQQEETPWGQPEPGAEFGEPGVDGDLSPGDTAEPWLQSPDRMPSFAELDTAGDGMLTYEEASQHPVLAEQFERWDVDRDGVISQEEFAAFETAHGVQPELERDTPFGAQPLGNGGFGTGEDPGAGEIAE